MSKYTITYGRTVQVGQCDGLHVELTHEFDAEVTDRAFAFAVIRDTVDNWINVERTQL